MQTFDIAGVPHRTRMLSAYEQWALLQTLNPALGPVTEIAYGLRLPDLNLSMIARLMKPIAELEEAEIASVMQACCDACERVESAKWVMVTELPRLADFTVMMLAVVSDNFAKLFALERPAFDRTELPYSYPAVSMADRKDWIYRPVLRGLCKLESLHDGCLRIEHIAEANIALDVADENEARARKAAEKAH